MRTATRNILVLDRGQIGPAFLLISFNGISSLIRYDSSITRLPFSRRIVQSHPQLIIKKELGLLYMVGHGNSNIKRTKTGR